MTVRVTIVIPVYNGANYLREAIDSALSQTWHNTEVIVVNDGSDDKGETDEIARAYGDRIRYIVKPNGGVASALNAGIAAMTGDVFCWLSHDDLHLPDKTAIQVAEWVRHGRGNLVLISDYRVIDETGNMLSEVRLDHEMLIDKGLYALLRGAIHGCSVFIPSHILDEIGGFDEKLPTTQDYDLWFRIIQRFPFVHIPQILIESRWHPEQGSKKIDHIKEATEFWLRVVDQVPVAHQESLEGSQYAFLVGMADFLSQNRLEGAANLLTERAHDTLSGILVTVIIPFFNRIDLAISALKSALAQTHLSTEVVMVDDGSTEDISSLLKAVTDHSDRVRLIRQPNRGAAAARNAGWAIARGAFVAFLDSDDLFLPAKVEIQMAAMLKMRVKFSHTSYYRCTDGAMHSLTRIASGARNHFPDMIASCSIATPTTMLSRGLIEEGFCFSEGFSVGEDIALWIKIAARHGVMGIDSALSIVRITQSSAAYDSEKQRVGVTNIIDSLRNDPEMACYEAELLKLQLFAKQLTADSEVWN